MIQTNKHLVVSLLLPLLLGSFSRALAQSVWRQSSFDDFKEGKFLDAGSDCYVSAKGRIQIISRWDFNKDGYLDIFLPSGHGQSEKENTYIYLNNGKDIDARSRIELPGGGSRGGVIADFNKDGLNDLAVVNERDSHVPRVPTWVYYGTENGFSPFHRAELPAAEGTSIAAGDFNGDGWLDLAVGCQYWGEDEDENGPRRSFIYWNSPKGFSSSNRLDIAFNGSGAVAVASKDLDGDGIDDLVCLGKEKLHLLLSSKGAFKGVIETVDIEVKGSAVAIGDANNDKHYEVAVCTPQGVLVLEGKPQGEYARSDATLLPVSHASGVTLCDVDKDGYDDVVVANLATAEGATWTNSFVFYSDKGNFFKRKPLLLPTLGASGVSCADLNGDGYPEIVFSNQRVTNERGLLSYVYWNDKGTFRFENHTQLPTQGATGSTIGDANNDGRPDVIFFNDEGHFRDGAATSTLYWGDGTRNYSLYRSTAFETHHVFGFGAADLDDDGNVEMIMALQGFIADVPHGQCGMVIKWNNRGRFDRETDLTMKAAYGGVRIADINKDGYLDILGSGDCMDLKDPAKSGFPIFWGSPQGFSFKNRTVLHLKGDKSTGAKRTRTYVNSIRGPLLMDLNNDGRLDIAGQVELGKVRMWWGSNDGFSDDRYTDLTLPRKDELMYIKAADFDKDGWLDLLLPHRGDPNGTESTSYIYYGSSTGFADSNMIQIKSFVPYQNCIADINKDGWLDIFLTSYGGEVSGNRPSLIYWGSAQGFQSRATEIETYGSSGVELLDYDGDGWLDALVADHRKSGSYFEPEPHRHVCPSLLYWGGPQGFSKANRSEFMAVGPSGLSLRDPGNSFDRGLYEDYFSSIHEMRDGELPASIKWEAETPFGTAVHFQIRAADSEKEMENAKWQGPEGENSWFTTSGSEIKSLKASFVQYRARLITPNGAATPYLTSVEIAFKRSANGQTK